MVELLLGLWDASYELSLLVWREANRWTMRLLRVIIVLTIIWPAIIIVTATFRSALTPVTVSALALMPVLIIVLWILFFMSSPLAWIALFLIPFARKALFVLLTVLGIEGGVGVYFALTPVAAVPKLVLPLVLCGVAFCLLLIGKEKTKGLRTGLAILILIFTIIFFVKGSNFFTDKTAWAFGQNPPSGMQPVLPKPSAAAQQSTKKGDVVIEDPLAPERPAYQPDLKLPPAPAAREYLPTSGDAGQIHIPLLGCRYINTGRQIGCKGYIQYRGEGDIPIRLVDSDGSYDTGNGGPPFRVWTSNGSILFEGGGFMNFHLIPGTKYRFEFWADAPQGVTSVSFHLQVGDTHGRFFDNLYPAVPVSLN